MVKTGRRIAFSGAAGVILAFCYAAGKPLDTLNSLELTDAGFYMKWLGLTLVCGVLVFCVWELFRRVSAVTLKKRMPAFDIPYPVCAVVLLFCWLPALLSLYPGAFAYDAYEEWQQVAFGGITSHHPVIHVILLGGLVELGDKLFGSYNAGILVYTLLQMIIVACVLSSVIQFLKKLHVPGIFRLLTLLYFGFSPVLQLFAICATKDVLFTAAELMFFIYAVRFCCWREEVLESKRQMFGFCMAAFFTMILRNNGFYIVLVTLFILAFVYRKELRQSGKRLGLMLLGIAIPYLLYVGPFYSMVGVTSGGVEEMLSVPLQQMARVYRYDYESLEESDLELLYSYVSRERLETYRATVSDFVKKDFQRETFEESKGEFVKLWAKWGMEHPLTYINSFLIGTVDIWYPGAVLDGYRHADGRSSYFDYQVDKPGEERILLGGLHEYYEAISFDAEAQKAPFAFIILSPGWYLVLYLVLFFYLWCEKRYKLLVPFLIPVLHFGTVLLGPVALVRYMLIFYYGFPVFLACVISAPRLRAGDNREETNDKI